MIETSRVTTKTRLKETIDSATGFFKQWDSSSTLDKPQWLQGKGNTLDNLYYIFHSGNKRLAVGFREQAYLATSWSDVYTTFISMALLYFGDKWNRQYDALTIRYDVLKPLDVTETETRNLNRTDNETRDLSGTDNQTRNLEGTEDRTLNITDKRTDDLTSDRQTKTTTNTTTTNMGTQNDGVFGFNSPTSVDSATRSVNNSQSVTGNADDNVVADNVTNTGTQTNENTGTDNLSRTDTGTIEGTTSETGTIDRTHADTGTISHERSGNDGKYTASELVTKELELALNNFYEMVFEDVDTLIANPLY